MLIYPLNFQLKIVKLSLKWNTLFTLYNYCFTGQSHSTLETKGKLLYLKNYFQKNTIELQKKKRHWLKFNQRPNLEVLETFPGVDETTW